MINQLFFYLLKYTQTFLPANEAFLHLVRPMQFRLFSDIEQNETLPHESSKASLYVCC
jgi:hypothetical protein